MTDKRCSLGWRDLERMTLCDLDDVHRALDFRDEVEAKARKASE